MEIFRLRPYPLSAANRCAEGHERWHFTACYGHVETLILTNTPRQTCWKMPSCEQTVCFELCPRSFELNPSWINKIHLLCAAPESEILKTKERSDAWMKVYQVPMKINIWSPTKTINEEPKRCLETWIIYFFFFFPFFPPSPGCDPASAPPLFCVRLLSFGIISAA